ERQHRIGLWTRNDEQRATLRRERQSVYLPEATLPDAIDVVDDLPAALQGADLVLIATPTAGLRETLGLVKNVNQQVPVVWACKGFESDTGLLPHQVVGEVIGTEARCAALSGPSFAMEVARGQPTALTLAAHDEAFARRTAAELHQPLLRTYFSDDLPGVEVGGAVKNVMAIATGVCDGLSLGQNARAALITRGLAELSRLGVAMGGRTETFMGLTGLGDLILTCTGDLSRNRKVGLELGRGDTLPAILKRLGHVAEGVNTAREVERRAAELGVDMPITRAVCDVLFRGVSAREAVEQLLARDPKAES
ncbi:MAG TPA: NAD(P)H-dependent glycerol-3-phosphate dehydrogenase, partial [Burkholderiales bacterium]|nr:NAD(P)H-dependent glycerol-3-phosphate dehydrogenase [Burkholderiales bacterium]